MTHSQDCPRVVKLGGSLLELPNLSERLRHWLSQQPPAWTVMVVGGGRLADVLRGADRIHQVGETESHWLCVRAMQINAKLVAHLLNQPSLVGSLTELREASGTKSYCVFDPWLFLTGEEPHLPPEPLPHGWHVTSDSIAARAAEVLRAQELVLLKSALPRSDSPEEWSNEEFVDRYFAAAAAKLPMIRPVNLRDPGYAQQVWRRGG